MAAQGVCAVTQHELCLVAEKTSGAAAQCQRFRAAQKMLSRFCAALVRGVVGRTCMGRNTGQIFIFVVLWGGPYIMCMLTWLLQVANLGSKRVICLVFAWQALFCVLDLHKRQ